MNIEEESFFKETLLKEGVDKLKNLGFTNVTKLNIITDEVYSFHFSNLLLTELGIKPEADHVINALLKSMSHEDNLKR